MASWYYRVVIIDNNSRFVEHCRMIFGKVLGYSTDLRRDSSEDREGSYVSLQNARIRFTHLRADHNLLSSGELKTLVSELMLKDDDRLGIRIFVDVVGEASLGATVENYVPEAVIQRILASCPWVYEHIQVISSYEVGKLMAGVHEFAILGKSPRLLHKLRVEIEGIIRSKICSSSSMKSKKPGRSLEHVLVTGAGFEARLNSSSPGVPLTSELLQRLAIKFDAREGATRPGSLFFGLGRLISEDTVGFPAMAFVSAGHELGYLKLKEAARNCDLDTWWDCFLQFLGSGAGLDREQEDLRYRREEELRSYFRAELEASDWGYLTQALTAAKCNWKAWLSTNYTRFADRAIAQEEQRVSGPPSDSFKHWAKISIAAEADALAARLEYSVDSLRFLFKLHGDIAHLNTMAIAGMDKRMTSPHAVKVVDIFRNYLLAGSYFAALRGGGLGVDRGFKANKFCWHIVGHGLWDSSLVNLLQKSMHAGDYVVIVDKDQGKISGIEDRLKKIASRGSACAESGSSSYIKIPISLHHVPRSAADYFNEIELRYQDGRLPDNVSEFEEFLGCFGGDSA